MKMNEKDSKEDIQKAFALFVDERVSEETGEKVITKDSLKRVVDDLEVDLTEQQILQLIYGANNLNIEDRDDKKEGKEARKGEDREMTVSEQQFISILLRNLDD